MITVLPKEEAANFLSGLPNLPQHFVVTKEYIELKNYVELILSGKLEQKTPQVVLTGSKGVGKSISLLVLAVEMTAKCRLLYFLPIL